MIPKLQQVLAVTDLSEHGDRAVAYAYSLVPQGGVVHLLHVIEHTDVPGPMIAHYSPDELNLPEKRAEAEQKVNAHLRTLIPKEASQAGVTTTLTTVFKPEIPQAITHEAAERAVDAVVMGSHGRRGLVHVLMGSVAEQVIRTCGLPVLVVPMKH